MAPPCEASLSAKGEQEAGRLKSRDEGAMGRGKGGHGLLYSGFAPRPAFLQSWKLPSASSLIGSLFS